MSENSTNTITEVEEQIALVIKMLVSTAGPGDFQELYTPQHIPRTPLSSWNWFSSHCPLPQNSAAASLASSSEKGFLKIFVRSFKLY